MRVDNVLTPTRVELGHRCYRRHVLSDIVEKGLYESAAAAFGSVMHAGVAEWWRSNSFDTALEALVEEYATHLHILSGNDKHTQALAESMLQEYVRQATKQGPILGEFQTVTIEERLTAELAGVKFSFQLDRLLSLDNRALVLVDLKTASRIDGKWRSQWDTSLQMRLYAALINKVYDMPVQIVVEGLLKTPKAKVEYYMCPEWSQSQLDEAIRQAKYISEKDKELLANLDNLDYIIEQALITTDFNYGDCYSYNTPCQFLKLCQAPPEERVGLLQSEYIDVISEY